MAVLCFFFSLHVTVVGGGLLLKCLGWFVFPYFLSGAHL